MVFEAETTDAFGHKKLGGIGDLVSEKLTELSPRYNNGKKIDIINQKLGYLVRCGDPDALTPSCRWPMATSPSTCFWERSMDDSSSSGNGRYDNLPIDTVTASKKLVNVKEQYNIDRLRPHYKSFEMKPVFIMTSQWDEWALTPFRGQP